MPQAALVRRGLLTLDCDIRRHQQQVMRSELALDDSAAGLPHHLYGIDPIQRLRGIPYAALDLLLATALEGDPHHNTVQLPHP
jgi:hypothetical protein